MSYSNLTEVFYTQPSRKYAPVGKVIPGVKVVVIDVSEGLKEVPMGVPGEVRYYPSTIFSQKKTPNDITAGLLEKNDLLFLRRHYNISFCKMSQIQGT